MRRLVLLCAIAGVSGCTLPSREFTNLYTFRQAEPPGAVVFAANGAGDGRTFSSNLMDVVAATGTPLQVEVVPWSRGFGRIIADEMDQENHREQGRKLAGQILAYHQAYPERRIYLAGHSAGCAVILKAAEMLPQNSVERIV